MQRIKDKNIYICLTLCFVIGVAVFGYSMYLNGGVLIVREDFNTQQIPFLTALNHYVKNFTGPWCWNVDLGTQMVGAFSFYNLGSPFVWLTFLFPKSSVPYLMGWFYILKYMVAGVTAYLYLKRFVKNSRYAILGGILYSFSGFQSTNLLFFHFHDVVAFFPILLIGLEDLIDQKKKTLFIFAVFVNCMINYFFFISEVIFLVLYYVFRFWKKDILCFLKDGVRCLFCGVTGVGMAAMLFLPSILYIMGNSRTSSSFTLQSLIYYGGYILISAKGFLLPGESMSEMSCVLPHYWRSTACYLPMIGGSLVFAYILKKRNDWLARLLLVLWIISCSPTMDSGFYLFTESYKRWWFMFVLMMAAASIMVLDEREKYPIKTGILINIILLILFCGALLYLHQASWLDQDFIYRKQVFTIHCGISFLGLLLTWFCCSYKNLSGRLVMISSFAGISVFCAATTFFALSLYQYRSETGRDYLKRYQLGLQLENIDDQYRYNLTDNVLIFPGEALGAGSFSSTVSNSILEFDMLFDYKRSNFCLPPDSVPGMRELLAARYQLTRELSPGQTPIDVVEVNDTVYYVTEQNVCPIGYIEDTYVTKEELKSLPLDKRGIAMLDNLVIDSEDEEYISSRLRHNESLDYGDDYNEISKLVALNQTNKVSGFTRDSSGFRCETVLKSDGAIFFSIPYDDGWSAYTNEGKVEILNCGGMMGLVLSPGNYLISFEYHIPGLRTGTWISVLSFFVFLLTVWKERRKTA